MHFAEDHNIGRYRIRSYRPGELRVNEETYRSSLLLGVDALLTDWPPRCLDELRPEHLQTLAEWQPDLVLLGTGARQRFPAAALLAPLYQAGIGVEVMDTGAACRTYNVLVAEDRRVAAALLID
ncbi:Mth938-like domain-containing protein [Thiohalobacter sp.]|uniref:Mth938-like domain-containing protein n=1 Tax=Thiohalobacter sp. TaxID=2025948 RepID=UPI0026134D1B|nr:Mth938-like domain-containing protein [Thiohalobacter sp.]